MTQTAFDEWDPQISSDGNRIVYAARKNGNWDLFLRDIARDWQAVDQDEGRRMGSVIRPRWIPDYVRWQVRPCEALFSLVTRNW